MLILQEKINIRSVKLMNISSFSAKCSVRGYKLMTLCYIEVGYKIYSISNIILKPSNQETTARSKMNNNNQYTSEVLLP